MKFIQVIVEQRPCEYTILGWSIENELYYRAICDGQVQAWEYDPERSGSPRRMLTVPGPLDPGRVPRTSVLEMVRATGVRPAKYESVTRSLLLIGGGSASPNGRWTAAITQHVYGPQDLVLLTPAD